jgi:CheY-like chemotaxis protein
MENFEEPVTAFNCAAHQLPAGVDLLEKGAFERGLPEIEVTHSGSNNHRMHENFQPHLNSALADELSHTPPVILLIDDEESFRCVIKQVLVNAGFEVVEAANGVQGIQYFYENPADMIITDIIMPEKEGIETMIELKKAFPNVKLIAMSGGGWYGTDIDFDMAIKLGAKTLDKPFALQDLLDVVHELLN